MPVVNMLGQFGRASALLASRALIRSPVRAQSAVNYNRGVVKEECDPSKVDQQLEVWNKADMTFYGPDRDFENFPPKTPRHPPACRVFFLPDSWFQFLYPKTGVSGGYFLLWGSLATLHSKEIIVFDHMYAEGVMFMSAFAFLTWMWGAKLTNYLVATEASIKSEMRTEPEEAAKLAIQTQIKTAERQIWEQEFRKYMYEAQKENILLQLEATYRGRLADIHSATKKRVDYMNDKLNATNTLQQEHMVAWIVDSVTATITPALEQEALTQCIVDLKTLAARKPSIQ